MKRSICIIPLALILLMFGHSFACADIRYTPPPTLKAAEVTGNIAAELRKILETSPLTKYVLIDVEVQCPVSVKDDNYNCNVLISNLPNTTSPVKVPVSLTRHRRADPAGNWSAKMFCYELNSDNECVFTKKSTAEQMGIGHDIAIELRKLAITAKGSLLKSHVNIECPEKTNAGDYSCALSLLMALENASPTKVAITGPTARILRSKGETFFRSATPGAVEWNGFLSCITGENRCEITFGGDAWH